MYLCWLFSLYLGFKFLRNFCVISNERPPFMKLIENESDILELDGFVVEITDSNSCNIKLKKGGRKQMDKVNELQNLIESYKGDLAEAVEARDKVIAEDVQAKIEEELKVEREKIEARVQADHEKAVDEANKTVELMNRIIARKESQLADMLAAETEVEINETIIEGV